MVEPAASEPSFQQAMEITAQWLGLWEQGELSDEVLADRVAELVGSHPGAGARLQPATLATDIRLTAEPARSPRIDDRVKVEIRRIEAGQLGSRPRIGEHLVVRTRWCPCPCTTPRCVAGRSTG